MASPIKSPNTEFRTLCANYLDIEFDIMEDPTVEKREHVECSSPFSNLFPQGRPSPLIHPIMSGQTTPTPNRQGGFVDEDPDYLSIPGFLHRLEFTTLPQDSKDLLSTVMDHVHESALLLASDGRQHGEITKALVHHNKAIVELVEPPTEEIRRQIGWIGHMKTLAPFQVGLSPADLWWNYRQKVQLIAEFSSLPCKSERKLVKRLIHIFNALVYEPFLQDVRLRLWPRPVERMVNGAYDALMTLLEVYTRWVDVMKDVKENHVLPILRTIQNSPEILQSIKAERENAAAVKAAGPPNIPPLDPETLHLMEQARKKRQLLSKDKA